MLSLILKNIWHRRVSNAWLFIELIIITIVTWVIIDPVVVRISDKMLPLGYDEDRLFYIKLAEQPSESPLYIDADDNDESRKANFGSIIQKLKSIGEIESVTTIRLPLNLLGIIEKFESGNAEVDSLKKSILSQYFYMDTHPFSTIGAEAAEGCPSIEELESMEFDIYDIVIPESVDRFYFPDHRGVNEKYLTHTDQVYGYEYKYKVVGIIKDLRLDPTKRNTAIVFHHDRGNRYGSGELIVRVKKGIDVEEYINDNTNMLRELCATGNYYVWSIYSAAESNRVSEVRAGITANRNLRISLAVLFLVNLILGVIGTVWLQTRRRISEIGILRSFGAMKINVRAMLICENLVLSVIAIIVGLLLYLQYAIKEGLFDSVQDHDAEMYIQNYSWVSDFPLHFIIVSAIVAAIILICVAIGTYLPARKASDIAPYDALRDE